MSNEEKPKRDIRAWLEGAPKDQPAETEAPEAIIEAFIDGVISREQYLKAGGKLII